MLLASRRRANSWWGRRRGTSRSDILGCLPTGRIFCCEVKRPGGKVSDAQKAFIDSINASGGLAFVAYSVEDVIARLGTKLSFRRSK